mgnify:CR=1 FL=1
MNQFLNCCGLTNIPLTGLVRKMSSRSLRMLLFNALLGVLCCGMTACGLMSESLSEGNNSQIPENNCSSTDSSVDGILNILNKYESILANNESYFSVENGESMTLAQLLELSQEENLQISQFALIDFDYDQIPELILKKTISESDVFGYEVLHQYGEDIYGYSFTYRTFADLKIDGTFVVSSSAYDYGIGKLEFLGDTVSIQRVAECKTLLNEDGTESENYTINGESVPECSFFNILEKQDIKKSIIWSDKTENTANELHWER